MSTLNFGGNNHAILTLTSPLLTPTTMRCLEVHQSMLDSTPYIEDHEDVGSFIPPLPTLNVNVSWTGGSVKSDAKLPSKPKATPVPGKVAGKKVAPNKKMARSSNNSAAKAGGRRPKLEKNISPAEEERRKQRRVRNKEAAARCRQRRVDLTNKLLGETSELETEKARLQSELQQLQEEKNRLEIALKSHEPSCNSLTKAANNNNLTTVNNHPGKKPARPTSLPVTSISDKGSLETPSTGLDFNWANLTPTGVTPTPLTPSATTNLLSFITDDSKPAKKSGLVQL